MFRLMQLLGLDKSNALPAAPASLLVITRDSDLYSRIREIVSAWNWRICLRPEPFARPVSGPNIAESFPIVVYDNDSGADNWKEVLARLRATEGDPCILLVSRVFDPYLWNEVIRCGGFDVIAKSAEREQLIRTLRFAWFWKKKSRLSQPGSGH